MTRTRKPARPLTPTRATPVETEGLEPRRLFAGGPGPRFAEVTLPSGMEVDLVMTRDGPAVVFASLPWGGRMAITTDGRSTTASSVSASSASESQSDATPAPSPAALAYGRPALPTARPAANDAAHTAVVQQVLPGTPDAADAPVTPATPADARTETHNAAAERMFGPFAILDTAKPDAAPTGTGLASLLSADRSVTGSLLRQTTETTPRARPGPAQAADPDAEPIVTTQSPATADQASLVTAFDGTTTMRPLWERVAMLTAGVALVAVNWAVRRRTRHATATGVSGHSGTRR